MGPNSKILASRSSSGLGRTSGGGLAWAVGVDGCLWDLREPKVRGRASDGATTATDISKKTESKVTPDTVRGYPKKLGVL